MSFSRTDSSPEAQRSGAAGVLLGYESSCFNHARYDLLNHLTGVSMTRPTGTQTRSFVYNGNFLMSATNAENGTVRYAYNGYGKVATRTDAKGQEVVYSYL